MFKRIVKFRDGTYGIRKTITPFIKYKFQDLVTPELWWGKNQRCYRDDCRSNNLERVKELMKHKDYVLCSGERYE